MSNRGRQNVASHLVLDLGVDWRRCVHHAPIRARWHAGAHRGAHRGAHAGTHRGAYVGTVPLLLGAVRMCVRADWGRPAHACAQGRLSL